MSERDGWNHLYLYDGVAGRVKNQITKGEWVVRGVQGGRGETPDLVQRQWHVSRQGPVLGPLLPDRLRRLQPHDVDRRGREPRCRFSTGQEVLVDTYSRVDVPQVSSSGARRTIARVPCSRSRDIAALVAAGFKPPEVFTAKGRDGKTDIWGVIVRPTNFDPKKKYPVIENIYAGPHGSFVPKTFAALHRGCSAHAPSWALSSSRSTGWGRSNRSKAFHDVAWKNVGDAGFPDRILWHKAAAAKYPVLRHHPGRDLRQSAGGQNSLGGLLFHPDFYKVAVSYAGCHDNRMDKIGGTSSGWDGRSTRATPGRRTWTTRGASRVSSCSSSASWT